MVKRWLSPIGVIALVLSVLVLGLGQPAVAGGPPGLDRAVAAQERHTGALMATPGVVGTAVGLTEDGTAAVLVFTEGPGVAGVPASLDGVPVQVHITGKISALAGPPPDKAGKGGSELKPTSRWPRPVPIGVSTGPKGPCLAGTIGARVKSGDNVYALSNNHVYANENKLPTGTEVLQPGLYDTSCIYNPDNVIGALSAFVTIVFSAEASNVVDAAIARSSTANLGKATPSNGYGTPKSATATATLYLRVMKYGRTTSLTKGSVVGINATVNIGYSSGTARFVQQIVILGNKPFLRAGDSGSLVVTDPGKNPVGLAFAGSANGYAFANPINAVLDTLGVSIDGE